MSTAVTNSRGIDNTCAERVTLLEHHGLPSGMRIENVVIEGIGLL